MATLIHRYRFENNADDSVGSNNGVVTGTYYTTDPKEGLYSLNNDSYNIIGEINSLITSATAQFSFSYWIKDGVADLIFRDSSGYNGIYMYGGGTYLTVNWGDATNRVYSQFPHGLSASNWIHVVVTYDYTNASLLERIKVYANSLQLSRDAGTVFGTYTTLNNMIDLRINSPSCVQKLDDFRIYSGVLNQQEINEIYMPTQIFSAREYPCVSGSASWTLLMWYQCNQTAWGTVARIGELDVFIGSPASDGTIGLGNNSVNIKASGVFLDNNSWHLIAIVNDNGTCKIGVDNGALSSTFTAPSGHSSMANKYSLKIGGNKTFNTYDVRLYNKVLTAEQIDYYYDETLKTNPSFWEY